MDGEVGEGQVPSLKGAKNRLRARGEGRENGESRNAGRR